MVTGINIPNRNQNTIPSRKHAAQDWV